MTDLNNTEKEDFDKIDWHTFRFPPRPPKKANSTFLGEEVLAPAWACPPQIVRTWKLDMERLLIIHPVLRKKIDLSRINSKQRLVQLCQVVKTQANAEDGFALWNALDEAINSAWGLSLPEMLSVAPDRWDWPRDETYIDEDN